MEEKKKMGYKDVFKHKDFVKKMIAALINRFGDSVDAIASTWIMYEITASATWSALEFGVNKLPTVLITPLAGAFVEGRNKKRIMIITDIIRALCVAYVATAFLLGFLQSWHLLITTFIISTVEAFRGPASTALTPKILPVECYEYGMSLSESLGTVIELLGTGLAAGIIAVIGISGAIYIDMATFILSALIIATMNSHEGELIKKKFEAKAYFDTLKEGFKYTVNKKIVFLFCIIALFLNGILVPLNSLQAPLVSEVLGGGAEALSVLGLALTISMLAGSALYPMIRKRVNGRTFVILGGLSIVLFYIGIIVAAPLYASKLLMYVILAVLCIILGFTLSLLSAYVSVEFIKMIDDGYLARVGAISTALSCAIMPVISFLVSGITKFAGTGTIFIGAGICGAVITIVVAMNRSLKEIN